MDVTEIIQFLLRVECFTFNHSLFIADAMNGFVMQQCSFPFVCTIVDDASTDGEQEVIKTYLQDNFDLQDASVSYVKDLDYGQVLFSRHKSNKNCYFAVVLLKENHYSQGKSKDPYLLEWLDTEYVAICEGDDYWTSPDKLQRQVDFLQTNKDFSMCFHSARVSLEGVPTLSPGIRFELKEDREYYSTEVFVNWVVPTASIVFRREQVLGYKLVHPEWLTRGDIGIVLRCTHTGRVLGMKSAMSVYRLQPESVSHNQKYRGKEVFILPNHFKCILKNFPKVNPEPIRWCISHSYYSRMKCQSSLWKKFRDFVLCFFWHPRFAFNKLISCIRKFTLTSHCLRDLLN